MSTKKRAVEVAVISDIHLGTYGCNAHELHRYLKSIQPKILILNGDIIDIWQFSKRYFPNAHMKIIKQIFSMAAKGVEVYYVTGNHDEMLRKFEGFTMGTLKIVNKLVLELDGKKAWIFHGDVFDITMKHSKWLAKLGAIGYDSLILLNAMVNFFSVKLGKGKVSFSKRIKNSVKSAIKFIDDFENTAADIAISNGYDYVVCGHIHNPEIRKIANHEGQVTYMNSGDWIENLTALEYKDKVWALYRYSNEIPLSKEAYEEDDKSMDISVLYSNLLQEFQPKKV
ncbi:UDP-2,3-diacylglucosamine diphosphatase [Catalinimonas niigatensis]|uniref:UDP-2,3-diacylglucosamine diphosphatase n=1 Tax=Catalinimonas niigatensis TaxID=1397264 RepID=UPI002666FCB6|nr:UDP-2,3-diacylglucosamine diphosphatase [Catalinimonas niigatensis]WPP51495.1 UDP-2,3-diacylglucosamine diphosphatase [Catalinimonas niigatensis]